MAKITIDGKEYDTEKLPKEVINLVNSIAFVDNEVQRLQNQIKIYQAARTLYSSQLKELLKKLPLESDEKVNFS